MVPRFFDWYSFRFCLLKNFKPLVEFLWHYLSYFLFIQLYLIVKLFFYCPFSLISIYLLYYSDSLPNFLSLFNIFLYCCISSTNRQASCHLHLSYFSIYLRIVYLQLWYSQYYICLSQVAYIYSHSLYIIFVVHIYFHLVCDGLYTIICTIYIFDCHWSIQLLQPKFMFCCHFSVYKYFCYTTIQEHFYCYSFICVHFLYSNVQPYFSQYFECSSDISLLILLLCCTFWNLCPCTTLLYFSFYRTYYYFLVLPWFLFSCPTFQTQDLSPFCSNTLSPTASFLLYSTHCTLVISPLFASSSLQFHTFWQKSHHIFLNCLSKKKPYS